MLIGLLGNYWWMILLAIALILVVFIWVAGRDSAGGPGSRIKAGWSRWRAFSRAAGELQGRVILTLFYFTIVAPFGALYPVIADPLKIRRTIGQANQRWLPRRTRDLTLDDARRQF